MTSNVTIEVEHISDPTSEVVAINEWLSYEVESDLFSDCDTFTLRVTPRKDLLDFFRLPGHVVRIMRGNDIQMTGTIEATPTTVGAHGPQLELTGRDFGALLESDAPLVDFNFLSLMDIANALILPWADKIRGVIMDYSLHRWRICGKKARKHADPTYLPLTTERMFKSRVSPGESVNSVLNRLAPHIGCHSWFAADGFLVIGRPNYKQEPLHKLYVHIDDHGNTIKSNCTLSRSSDIGDRYSDYVMVGQGYGNATQYGKVLADHYSTARDPSKAFWLDTVNRRLLRSTTESLRSIQDKKQLRRAARTKMEKAAIQSYSMTGEVMGHEVYEDGPHWAINTVIDVDYQPKRIAAPHLVSRRQFAYDADEGDSTNFSLIPCDIWLATNHDAVSDSAYVATMTKLFDRYAL